MEIFILILTLTNGGGGIYSAGGIAMQEFTTKDRCVAAGTAWAGPDWSSSATGKSYLCVKK
jgi:hypothetical protein